MHIQRIRPNEIIHILSYFVILNCKFYQRDEALDHNEKNLLNYLKTVSEFSVTILHRQKELRRSARAVAINGIDQITSAELRRDYFAVREYLKDCLIAYIKLAFGKDFVDLLEDEVKVIVSLMDKKSYDDFISDPINELTFSVAENNILVEGTKLNFIKH